MVDKLRRGFKAEAERLALSLRAELGLKVMDRLDPLALAAHLDIPVLSLPELRLDGASSHSVSRLMGRTSGFSALTICDGTRRLIVYNPRHPPTRRANSVAHEVSHVLLEHPPAPALGEGGCRYWDSRLEDEADWQAAALLVPRDGAFAWLRAGGTLGDGAVNFGVSLALFRWRVHKTGVARQLAAMGVTLS
ncbi:MAG TPA: ImmA/IrrE family metallo-endopeptidase [Gemmataceae bacterium]|nr:ImmA/IrrE family metallo-endopeptidase [Gemmataceae bacterium]